MSIERYVWASFSYEQWTTFGVGDWDMFYADCPIVYGGLQDFDEYWWYEYDQSDYLTVDGYNISGELYNLGNTPCFVFAHYFQFPHFWDLGEFTIDFDFKLLSNRSGIADIMSLTTFPGAPDYNFMAENYNAISLTISGLYLGLMEHSTEIHDWTTSELVENQDYFVRVQRNDYTDLQVDFHHHACRNGSGEFHLELTIPVTNYGYLMFANNYMNFLDLDNDSGWITATDTGVSLEITNVRIPYPYNEIPLYVSGLGFQSSSIPLYIEVPAGLHNAIILYIDAIGNGISGEVPLFVYGGTEGGFIDGSAIPLYVQQTPETEYYTTLFIQSPSSATQSKSLTFYIDVLSADVDGHIPLYLTSSGVNNNIPLYVSGQGMFDGAQVYGKSMTIYIERPYIDYIPLYLTGAEWTLESGEVPLYVPCANLVESGVPLVMPSTISSDYSSTVLYTHGYV